MMSPMIDVYREAGVAMLPVTGARRSGRAARRSPGELVLAPLSARGTPWMRRLGDISDAFASGLMRVRGVRRQRAFDRGFVLSDHADWPALLPTVARPARRASSPPTATPSRSPATCASPGSSRRHPDGVGGERSTARRRCNSISSDATAISSRNSVRFLRDFAPSTRSIARPRPTPRSRRWRDTSARRRRPTRRGRSSS